MERGEGTVALRQRRGGPRVETNDIPHSGWREPSAARGQQLSRSSARSQPVAEGEDGLTLEVVEARASHVSEPRPRGMDGGTAPGLHR